MASRRQRAKPWLSLLPTQTMAAELGSLRPRVWHGQVERLQTCSFDSTFYSSTSDKECGPKRLPGLGRPCYAFCPQLACVGSRQGPRLLAASIARQTGAKHYATASSRQSVCGLWRNCHFGRAPELSQPGLGYCWHQRSALGHHPIEPAAVEPDAFQHEAANSRSHDLDASKKGERSPHRN